NPRTVVTLFFLYAEDFSPSVFADLENLLDRVTPFDKARIEELVRQHFGSWQGAPGPRPRPVFPVPDHAETLFAIATDPEATASSVGITVTHARRPEETVGDYRRKLVENLYYALLNARLREIATRPDPPFVAAFTGGGQSVRPIEITTHRAVVADGGIERGFAALLTEVERVRRHGFTATELARARLQLLRGLERRFAERDKQESQALAGQLARHFLTATFQPDPGFELATARQLLPGIELAEVNRLASEWNVPANRVIEVNAPEKPQQPRKTAEPAPSAAASPSVPSEQRLRAALGGVSRSVIEAWVDRVGEGPLVPAPPRPGEIVAETRIAEIGATEWRLSNGVRVVLKPTAFKNDSILLSGFRPGGLSLVPDAEYTSAELAASLVREAGLGSFDQVTLGKALTGKVANAVAALDDFEEVVNGLASPRDVETMFQLTYLAMTSPRKDERAFQSAAARTRALLENRLARPEVAFADKMNEALTQGDPRERPLTVERLRELDSGAAYRIYRERFADATGFTFFLVGNFTLEEIRGPVLTYLGGLPAQGRMQTWRPVGAAPPAGIVRVAVRKGVEQKSLVRIVFTGAARYTRENLHDIEALARLLRIRLRQVLREDLSGTYGASVAAQLELRPQERYQLSIGFGCDPEKADALVAAVFAEIRSIKDKGVAETYVNDIRQAERREREVALQQNEFWLSVLANSYRAGFDPRDILHYDQLIERVTAPQLQATARDLLHDDRYVLGVLTPETAAEAPAAAKGKESAGTPR
nr:insulinase family protein [Acidobacteriota bacterium]